MLVSLIFFYTVEESKKQRLLLLKKIFRHSRHHGLEERATNWASCMGQILYWLLKGSTQASLKFSKSPSFPHM